MNNFKDALKTKNYSACSRLVSAMSKIAIIVIKIAGGNDFINF